MGIPIRGVVVRVIDGDTVWIRVRVRLLRSTEELHTFAGEQAHVIAARRWPPGTRVMVSPQTIDTYGRILGELEHDRTNDTAVR